KGSIQGNGPIQIDDPRWHGYLANIAPSEWEQRYRDRVPETLGGAAFLERYSGTTDSVTQVDPARTYAVRRPTSQPISEHHRVRLFRALLESLTTGSRPPTTDPEQNKETGRQGELPNANLLVSPDPGPPALYSSVVGRQSSAVGEETFTLLGELMYQSHA